MNSMKEGLFFGYLILFFGLLGALTGCSNLPSVERPAPAPVSEPANAAAPAPAPAPAPVSEPPAAAAPVSAPAPAPVPEKAIFSSDVFFNFKESRLTSAVKANLDSLVAKIFNVNTEAIILVGHADDVGTDAYNHKLSIARAEAVKNYLAAKGVNSNLVFTEAKGERQPVAKKGNAKNDRVEITVLAKSMGNNSSGMRKQNDVIPVLFAPNRTRTGSDNPFYYYGNNQSDEDGKTNLRHGIAVIKIPLKRQRGEVRRPNWIMVTFERFSSHPIANAFGLPTLSAADADTQFSYVQKIEELTPTAFGKELRSAIDESKSKTAVLYVHGYANDFTDAAFRTAQFAYDLATPDYEVVPIMFSWPSDSGILGPSYDEARKRSELSGYHLADFLKEIADTTNIGTVHIIAHSMGAEVLGHAILKLGVNSMGLSEINQTLKPRFRQIIFAAPDVTPRIFHELIEPAIKTKHKVTTYASAKDLPLWISAIKSQQARVGSAVETERLAECVDTIDVSVVARHGLAHSTWAESSRVLDDLRLVLRDGLEPSMRGLKKRRLRDRTIWGFQATPPAPMPTSRTPVLPTRPTCGPLYTR